MCRCSATGEAYHQSFEIETSEPAAIAGPFPLNGREYIRVQVVQGVTGSWGAAVLELVYRLAPGCPYLPFSTAVEFTSAATSTTTPVSCVALKEVAVRVKTVNGSAMRATVHFSREA